MALRLKNSALDAMKREGENAYPHECCGFLVGVDLDHIRTVEEAVPVKNDREDSPHDRFLIPPERVQEASRSARGRKREVVGFYHSHPEAAACPSAFDLEHAWPWYSYVVVSVKQREATEVASWRMAEDRSGFLSEEIILC